MERPFSSDCECPPNTRSGLNRSSPMNLFGSAPFQPVFNNWYSCFSLSYNLLNNTCGNVGNVAGFCCFYCWFFVCRLKKKKKKKLYIRDACFWYKNKQRVAKAARFILTKHIICLVTSAGFNYTQTEF